MVSEKTDVLYLTRNDMFLFNELNLKFEDISRLSFTPMIYGLIATHSLVIFTDNDGRIKILKKRY